MSATLIYAELLQRYATIPGIKSFVLGEPTAVHECPAIYTAYVSFIRPLRNTPPARNLEGTEHTFTCRLVLNWTEPASAEAQLLDLITAIPDAIDADPHLNSSVPKGMASCRAGSAGYLTIGQTLYRIADYTITVLEKREGV